MHDEDQYDQSNERNPSQMKRQRFTPEEDELLKRLVGESSIAVNWKEISMKMKNRTSRQCRERYKNYLKPNITKKNWTQEEDQIILTKFNELGPKWVGIARFLVGRSGNDTRNRYLALVRKRKYKNTQIGRQVAKPIEQHIFIPPEYQKPEYTLMKKDPAPSFLISDFEKSVKQTQNPIFQQQIGEPDLFSFYTDNV